MFLAPMVVPPFVPDRATDFREYAVGNLDDNDWTGRSGGEGAAFTVESHPGSLSDKRVKFGNTANDVKVSTWDKLDAVLGTNDCEILALLQTDRSGNGAGDNGLTFYFSFNNQGTNCVFGGFLTGTNTSINRFFGGVGSEGSGSNISGMNTTDRWWFRFKRSGGATSWQSKIWKYGAAEPAAFQTSYSHVNSANLAGLFMVNANTTPTNVYCEWFSAAIGTGLSAPGPSG